MVATAALDLTQAILIGLAISAIIYIRQSAVSTAVSDEPVDTAKLRTQGYNIQESCPSIHIYYLTGPLFFGSVHTVLEALASANQYHTLVISMRGVPLVDAMGVKALGELIADHQARGGAVAFSGLQPAVREMFDRAGLTALIGADQIYWSAIQAILQLHETRQIHGCPHCDIHGDGCTVLLDARAHLNSPPAAT
jgi:SulP family sulfate permease